MGLARDTSNLQKFILKVGIIGIQEVWAVNARSYITAFSYIFWPQKFFIDLGS